MQKTSNMNLKQWFGIFLRGAGMGAADVVPGVSGGTVAFITGIYQRLLNAIAQVNLQALQTLRNEGLKSAWQHVDGTFLVAVFSGLLCSAISLAKLMTYLLAHHKLYVWAFFFGLILASFIHLVKQVKEWHFGTLLSCLAGCIIAVIITSLAPTEVPQQHWRYLIAGMIGICAMILPGISGSFILLLLGMYGHVMTAINERMVTELGIFAMGCAIGLMVFSRFLNWLLAKYYQLTFALLSGFLLGSLNLLWPWKQVLSTYTSSSGDIRPLKEANVLPSDYFAITGQSADLMICILLAVLGLSVVLLLEFFTRPKGNA